MNFSKLLCLVLVYSEQFGQVLADTTPECTGNDGGADVPCNGKKGGSVKLKVNSQTAVSQWTKGGADLTTADDTKYTVGSTAPSSLTILKLETLDDGVYKTKDLPSTQQSFKVKVVDCIGDTSTPAICKGKKGGSIKLGLKDGTANSITWKKGNDLIGTGDKYEGPVNEATLTIKKLDDVDDDAEYTGGSDEKFSIQVAPVCLSSDASCVGKLSRDLVLKVEGSVPSQVTWMKDSDPLTGERYVKSGTNDVELMILKLVPTDKGSYTATYGTEPNKETKSFAVSIPENDPDPNPNPNPAAETVNNGKKNNDDSKGSSKTNSTTTEKPAPKDKGSGAGGAGGGGGGGGGGVLSYSPALLVTVTLVHLLLQLAA